MRFLYGDSAPFALNYNFLATLEVFMTAATRIVQLESDARELTRQTDALGAGRVKGLEALDQFHTVVMRAVRDTAQKVQHAHALDYAQKVAEFASRYVEDQRRVAGVANEREAAHVRTENDRRVAEQRTHLESFLRQARLPVLATKVAMHVIGDGKEARPHVVMSAVFDNPNGIQTAFNLSTSKVASWAVPRKVSDFAQGVELLVGVDKSWLRGTVTPKQVNVDDWVITDFDLSSDAFALTIRRKIAEKDALQFVLRRTDAALVGKVEHPGQLSAEALDGQLGSGDLAALDRVWQALRLATRDVLEHKEQLVSVSLDGTPVFDGGLVLAFVVRLVAMFAPTVREITERSPNQFELSLKQESDDGRREEIYMRREQLVSKLQPLSSAGREIFAPLGLDSWVPGLSTAPPPVVASHPPAVPGSASASTPPGAPGAPGASVVPGASAPPAPPAPAAPPSAPAAPGSGRKLPEN